MEKVVVVGMWYVWFPLACAIVHSKKYEVIWLDLDVTKIDKINKRISPVDDKQAERDIAEIGFPATTDSSVLANADYILVCVPTPVFDDFLPDLWPIRAVTKSIAKYLRQWQNIIIESTINPGVCDEIVIPILEETGLKLGKDFEVAHCPERINPGDEKWNVYNIPRNIWASTTEWTKRIADFYRNFILAPINEMKDIRHAEATKIIENTFRDVNIAYVNELAKSFDILWLDIVEVIRGASNKPFAFMPHYPWCGVGWHCIPVDPYYLIERAKQAWFDHQFLRMARETNNSMPEYLIDKLIFALNGMGKSLKWTKVWLLGLSYKKDVADLRESPALEIQKFLNKYEAIIDVYEPFNLNASCSQTIEDVIRWNEVLLLATNHSIFEKNIIPEKLIHSSVRVVVDGKNCLDKQSFVNSGIQYIGIGR